MTTILADHRLGLMAADSAVSTGEAVARMRKVWRINGVLVGLAGDVTQFEDFLAWYRSGFVETRGPVSGVSALELSDSGLVYFAGNKRAPVQGGRDAIGSGKVAALSAYEALGHTNPGKAVRIVCKHDGSSRAPVRVYKLHQDT